MLGVDPDMVLTKRRLCELKKPHRDLSMTQQKFLKTAIDIKMLD